MRLEGKFQRYPPNKRPNFLKLGTAAPFHCPWQLLVNEWKRLGGISPATHGIGTGSFGSFFVIRNLKLLVLIGDMISGKILLDSLMHDHKVLMETHSEVRKDCISKYVSKWPFGIPTALIRSYSWFFVLYWTNLHHKIRQTNNFCWEILRGKQVCD